MPLKKPANAETQCTWRTAIGSQRSTPSAFPDCTCYSSCWEWPKATSTRYDGPTKTPGSKSGRHTETRPGFR
eukprot:2691639-Rhodomonas_salina.1